MTQAAWAFHGTCVMYHRPVSGQMMYTDIDFGITSFNYIQCNIKLTNNPYTC